MINIDKIHKLIRAIDTGEISKDSAPYYLQTLTDEELSIYNQHKKDVLAIKSNS